MATVAGTSERIVTLDVIRGVAVMGIFSVNVIAFAMIGGAYFNPGGYGGHTGMDLVVWAANMVIIDGKLRTLFSMLFGASMLLVIERAEAAGDSGWSIHARRMLVLLLIGLAHFYLLWWGDILHLYAVIGLVAFAFRNKPPQALLVWALVFLAVEMVMFGAIVASIYYLDAAAHAPGATAAVISEWNSVAGQFYPSAADLTKDMAIHRGSFSTRLQEMVTTRVAEPLTQIFVLGPETLSLMLFGMWGYKTGFLTGAWDDQRYRRIAATLIAIGALAFAAVVVTNIASNFYLPQLFASTTVATAPFRPLMAFGYAALIILLSSRRGWFAERIAAVGRTAFTNYLGTSLVATPIFYGWGLGLYGQLSRAEAWLLAPFIWLLMLAWSKPWLERYRYGPLEWLWRSLARGRLQPMRKASGSDAVAAGA